LAELDNFVNFVLLPERLLWSSGLTQIFWSQIGPLVQHSEAARVLHHQNHLARHQGRRTMKKVQFVAHLAHPKVEGEGVEREKSYA
jgi:hypothetical protein